MEEKGHSKKQEPKSQWEAFTYVGGIGFQIVGTVAMCLFAGQWVDSYFELGKTGTVTGIVLGFLVAIWSTYKNFVKK